MLPHVNSLRHKLKQCFVIQSDPDQSVTPRYLFISRVVPHPVLFVHHRPIPGGDGDRTRVLIFPTQKTLINEMV
jgi:hypothetical protein